MNRKLAYAAGLLVGTSLATPAFAQDEDQASARTPAADNVIIVTATRRASDVQDIPIAVTAVTPQELNRQGVNNIQTLSTVAPSFNIQSSQTESQGTSIRIRGIGTTGNNIGLESAVGVFIDGVYQSRPGVALGELVDVQQVEILRGPQGTLFGRNTTAGAVVVRNNPPDLNDFGGFVEATYGNYNFINVKGAVNAPVGETFGVRLTGAYRKRDGFLIDASGNDVNNKDRYMLRGQALWEPSPDMSLRSLDPTDTALDAWFDTETSLTGATERALFAAPGGSLPNLYAYLLGLDPEDPAAAAELTAPMTAGDPVTFAYDRRRDAAAYGLDVLFEVSSALAGPWGPAVVRELAGTALDTAFERVTLTLVDPATNEPIQFIRYRLAPP